MQTQHNYKLDLHTHSTLSYDGGLSQNNYVHLLSDRILDYVAITDHNEIDFAIELHEKLGEKIIIGEEILTLQGEIIGLFLTKKIAPHQSISDTIKQIKNQQGLIYIPHPYEFNRHGLNQKTLNSIVKDIDIIEIKNARSMTSHRQLVQTFASKNNISLAASSDAHSIYGIGTSYEIISQIPSRKNLKLLLAHATRTEQTAPWLSFLSPKLNRFKKFLNKIQIY